LYTILSGRLLFSSGRYNLQWTFVSKYVMGSWANIKCICT
jgi:hypothetical protein